MPKIRVIPSGQEYEYKAGKNLLEILLDKKVFVDNPCNGKGTCGKCKIKIVSGNVAALGETEERFLTKEEIETGVRLSCLIIPEGDLEIELLQKERQHKVLTKGYVPEFVFEPFVKEMIKSISCSIC